MANTFRRFLKGIVLKPETAAPSEQVEGSVYHNGTDERLGTFIEALDREILTDSQAQTLTNKSIDANDNTITNIGDAELTTGINANKIADGSVSNTEFQYINSVTSNVQTQIDSKASQVALDAHINDVSDAHDASAISYDNVSSGLTATEVQDAIDELRNADAILYDNTVSGLTATEVQAAIDELATAPATGANDTLSNLASPTAINQDLLPSASGIRDIGADSNVFDTIYANTLRNDDSGSSISLLNSQTLDSSASASFNYNARQLLSGATVKLDYSGTDISVNTRKITDVSNPTNPQDAATKDYVDNSGGGTVISGTPDVIAKFNALGDNVEDSNMTDDGTNIIMDVPPLIKDAEIHMTDDGTDKLFLHTRSNNAPTDSVFIGFDSGTNITTGALNTALGINALRDIDAGGYNVAIGHNALLTVTSEQFNVGVGVDVLSSISGGTHNTAVGHSSLLGNTNGGQNAAFGMSSMAANTSGESNSGFGASSLGSNTLGNHNTAIGFNALGNYNGTSGLSGYNVAIGSGAGATATGDSYYNLFIGPNSGPVASGAVTQKLYIDCGGIAASDTPLIYGDGSTRFVRLHSSLQLPEAATPAAPATDYSSIHYATDGVLLLQDESGALAALSGKEHTQTINNNQVGATAVTDMVYSSATYRSIKISYSINRTTSIVNITQTGYIILRVDSVGWNITDNSDQGSIIGVTFTVNTGTGQVSYTSTNASGTGHVGTLKWCVKDKFIL